MKNWIAEGVPSEVNDYPHRLYHKLNFKTTNRNVEAAHRATQTKKIYKKDLPMVLAIVLTELKTSSKVSSASDFSDISLATRK